MWYNDPDPVYVRDEMPLKHAQLVCSWVALTGQLNLSSEWLPGLPPERLAILQRTMPGHGLLPRPVDLFEHDPPRIWLLTDDRGDVRRDVIGLFNWDDEEATFDETLERSASTRRRVRGVRLLGERTPPTDRRAAQRDGSRPIVPHPRRAAARRIIRSC